MLSESMTNTLSIELSVLLHGLGLQHYIPLVIAESYFDLVHVWYYDNRALLGP